MQIHLHDWATRPGHLWPCSELAHLEWILVALEAKGDLVEIINDPEDLMADELNAWIEDVLGELPGSGKWTSNATAIQPDGGREADRYGDLRLRAPPGGSPDHLGCGE